VSISASNTNADGTSSFGGSWSGGAGVFANANNAATTYTPAASEIGTSVNLTWTASDPDASGPCTGGQTDVVAITINNGIAAVDAGTDITTCYTDLVPVVSISAANTLANGASNLNGTWSGGAGVIANATSASTTYTPAASEIGTVASLTWTAADPDGFGPCTGGQTDVVAVTVNDGISSVNAGSDLLICHSSTATLNAGAIRANGDPYTTGVWTGGNGTFSPNRSAYNATYTPTLAEINTNVNLTWTAADPDGSAACADK